MSRAALGGGQMYHCERCRKPVFEPARCSMCAAPICPGCWEDYGFCARHPHAHPLFEQAVRLARRAAHESGVPADLGDDSWCRLSDLPTDSLE
jgi:hypothetical protein